jgi:protease I
MKIACLLGPDFEDSEFKEPYDAFRNSGHEVVIVGLQPGVELQGSKGKVKTTADRSFNDVKPEEFDALLIPGGYSPDKLRARDEAVAFVKSFVQSGKPIFAICHGPQLLLTANDSGTWTHRMTAWKTVQGDLKKAGANVVDEEVVVDRNLVTSRQPSDIPAFIRESLKVLEQVPAGRRQ